MIQYAVQNPIAHAAVSRDSVLDEGDDAMTRYAVLCPDSNRSRTLFHVLLSVVTHSVLDEGDDDTVRCKWPQTPSCTEPCCTLSCQL